MSRLNDTKLFLEPNDDDDDKKNNNTTLLGGNSSSGYGGVNSSHGGNSAHHQASESRLSMQLPDSGDFNSTANNRNNNSLKLMNKKNRRSNPTRRKSISDNNDGGSGVLPDPDDSNLDLEDDVMEDEDNSMMFNAAAARGRNNNNNNDDLMMENPDDEDDEDGNEKKNKNGPGGKSAGGATTSSEEIFSIVGTFCHHFLPWYMLVMSMLRPCILSSSLAILFTLLVGTSKLATDPVKGTIQILRLNKFLCHCAAFFQFSTSVIFIVAHVISVEANDGGNAVLDHLISNWSTDTLSVALWSGLFLVGAIIAVVAGISASDIITDEEAMDIKYNNNNNNSTAAADTDAESKKKKEEAIKKMNALSSDFIWPVTATPLFLACIILRVADPLWVLFCVGCSVSFLLGSLLGTLILVVAMVSFMTSVVMRNKPSNSMLGGGGTDMMNDDDNETSALFSPAAPSGTSYNTNKASLKSAQQDASSLKLRWRIRSAYLVLFGLVVCFTVLATEIVRWTMFPDDHVSGINNNYPIFAPRLVVLILRSRDSMLVPLYVAAAIGFYLCIVWYATENPMILFHQQQQYYESLSTPQYHAYSMLGGNNNNQNTGLAESSSTLNNDNSNTQTPTVSRNLLERTDDNTSTTNEGYGSITDNVVSTSSTTKKKARFAAGEDGEKEEKRSPVMMTSPASARTAATAATTSAQAPALAGGFASILRTVFFRFLTSLFSIWNSIILFFLLVVSFSIFSIGWVFFWLFATVAPPSKTFSTVIAVFASIHLIALHIQQLDGVGPPIWTVFHSDANDEARTNIVGQTQPWVVVLLMIVVVSNTAWALQFAELQLKQFLIQNSLNTKRKKKTNNNASSNKIKKQPLQRKASSSIATKPNAKTSLLDASSSQNNNNNNDNDDDQQQQQPVSRQSMASSRYEYETEGDDFTSDDDEDHDKEHLKNNTFGTNNNHDDNDVDIAELAGTKRAAVKVLDTFDQTIQLATSVAKRYFYVVSFTLLLIVLFRVNAIHVLLMFLSAAILLLRDQYRLFWTLLSYYSALLAIALYIVNLFAPSDSSLRSWGFYTQQNPWLLWFHFLCCASFLVQYSLMMNDAQIKSASTNRKKRNDATTNNKNNNNATNRNNNEQENDDEETGTANYSGDLPDKKMTLSFHWRFESSKARLGSSAAAAGGATNNDNKQNNKEEPEEEQQNWSWVSYIPLIERTCAGGFAVANLTLLAVNTGAHLANGVGFAFLLAFLILTTCVMYTSATRPPTVVRTLWTYITVVLVAMVALIYLFQVWPHEWQQSFEESLPQGVTLGLLGFSQYVQTRSLVPLLLPLSSSMLLAIQSRAWMEVSATNIDAAEEALAGTFFGSLITYAGHFVDLCKSFSVALAMLIMIGASSLDVNPMTAVYAVFVLVMGVSRYCREAMWCWRILQIYSGFAAVALYVVQLMRLHLNSAIMIQDSSYAGIPFEFNNDIMGRRLSPHLAVFVVTAFCAAPIFDPSNMNNNNSFFFLRHKKQESCEEMRTDDNENDHNDDNDNTTTENNTRTRFHETMVSQLIQNASKKDTPVAYASRILSNPLRYYRRLGFHITMLLLIGNTWLQRRNIAGLLYLTILIVIGSIGRRHMSVGIKTNVLIAILTIFVVMEYVTLLGFPPSPDTYIGSQSYTNFSASWNHDPAVETNTMNNNNNNYNNPTADIHHFHFFSPSNNKNTRQQEQLVESPVDAATTSTTTTSAAPSPTDDGDTVLNSSYFKIGSNYSLLLSLCLLASACLTRAANISVGAHPLKGFGAPTSLSVGERAIRLREKIDIARRTFAKHWMRRLIPIPADRVDFTQEAALQKSFMNRLKLRIYVSLPVIVLILTFSYCIYDATDRLSIAKLILLAVSLWFLQFSQELLWKANHWWNWMLRLHVLLEIARLVYLTPIDLPNGEAFDLLRRDNAPDYGPYWEYPVSDAAFHFIILMLLWIQSSCFDRVEYAFVLHYLFRMSQLGDSAAQILKRRRLENIVKSKQRHSGEWERLLQAVANVEKESSNHSSSSYEDRYLKNGALISRKEDIFVLGGVSQNNNPFLQQLSSQAETPSGKEQQQQEQQNDESKIHSRAISSTTPVPPPPGSTARTPTASPLVAQNYSSNNAASGYDEDVYMDPVQKLRLLKKNHPIKYRIMMWFKENSTFDEATWNEVKRIAELEDAEGGNLGGYAVIPTQEQSAAHNNNIADSAVFLKQIKREQEEEEARKKREKEEQDNNNDGARSSIVHIPDEERQEKQKKKKSKENLEASALLKSKNSTTTASGNSPVKPEIDPANIAAPTSSIPAAILYFCTSHLDFFCYMAFSIQFAISPCVLNAVLPIVSFVYAAAMNPRPHYMFWNLALLFLQICIVAKSLVKVFECREGRNSLWTGRICMSGGYFVSDLFLSLGCVVAMLLHKANLVAWGLWNDDELNVEETREKVELFEQEMMEQQRQQNNNSNDNDNINNVTSMLSDDEEQQRQQAETNAAVASTPIKQENNKEEGATTNNAVVSPAAASTNAVVSVGFRPDANQRNQSKLNQNNPLSLAGMSDGVTSFFSGTVENLFTSDTKTSTSDPYSTAVACELLSIIVLFLGYFRLMGEEDSIVSSLSGSLLPGTLTICVFLLFFAIVLDRVVYLRRSLAMKYALTVFATFIYSIVLLLWFDSQSKFDSTYYGGSPFWLRGALPLAACLFLLKMMYCFLSCRQIANGLPDYETHIVFTGNCSIPEQGRYLASRVTPFAFDLRVLLDWTVTTTFLKMNQWIRMEDIAHELYMTKCDLDDTKDVEEYKKKLTDPFPKWLKYLIGSIAFGLVALVLLGPLLLYSSVSPVVQKNSVSEISAVVSLPNLPPIWQTQQAIDGSDINNTLVTLMEKTRPSLLSSDFSQNTVQFLQLTTFSSSLWTVSPQAVHEITSRLFNSDSVSMTLDISILSRSSREAGSSLGASQILSQTRVLSFEELDGFVGVINGTFENVTVERMFHPFLSNKGSQFTVIASENSISCTFVRHENGRGTEVNSSSSMMMKKEKLGAPSSRFATSTVTSLFELRCRTLFQLSNPTTYTPYNNLTAAEFKCLNAYSNNQCPNEQATAGGNGTEGIFFVVESSQSLSVGFLQTIGIVAAYTTFVLAIGRVLRFVFSGMAFKVSIEALENPKPLIDVLQLMYMARARGNFAIEYRAYTCLVDTLRQAELLIRVTKETDKEK